MYRQDHGFDPPHGSHQLPGWLCELLFCKLVYFARMTRHSAWNGFSVVYLYPLCGSKILDFYWLWLSKGNQLSNVVIDPFPFEACVCLLRCLLGSVLGWNEGLTVSPWVLLFLCGVYWVLIYDVPTHTLTYFGGISSNSILSTYVDGLNEELLSYLARTYLLHNRQCCLWIWCALFIFFPLWCFVKVLTYDATHMK